MPLTFMKTPPFRSVRSDLQGPDAGNGGTACGQVAAKRQRPAFHNHALVFASSAMVPGSATGANPGMRRQTSTAHKPRALTLTAPPMAAACKGIAHYNVTHPRARSLRCIASITRCTS